MLCSTCSKRTSCKEICDSVELELKNRCNGNSAYKNKEEALSDMTMESYCFERYLQIGRTKERNVNIENTNVSKKDWMDIRNIIATNLTPKQRDNTILFLDGHSLGSIGRRNGISEQAVWYSIFGHPKQGGGAVRKIQKVYELLDK